MPQIARLVLRSEDAVARVLNRFLAEGLDAVPRRTPPGRKRRVTAEWEAELLRVIELDPHEVGAVARSTARGRVAIIIADNLKTHTAQGSLLVQSMVAELSDRLSLVYTPAYDPDANRIEWLWRISRRVVTHNQQRRDFEALLADVRTHFESLTCLPDELLRHIGSPHAPDKRSARSQADAA